MIVTATFERCTFRVKAARVTSKNLADIAEWCGGRVVQNVGGRIHVQVPTGLRQESIAHAYIGNWVTRLEETESFRVYKEQSFLGAFREIVSDTEKYAKVHELLMKVAMAQDAATYHGDSSGDVVLLIEKTAREICSII